MSTSVTKHTIAKQAPVSCQNGQLFNHLTHGVRTTDLSEESARNMLRVGYLKTRERSVRGQGKRADLHARHLPGGSNVDGRLLFRAQHSTQCCHPRMHTLTLPGTSTTLFPDFFSRRHLFAEIPVVYSSMCRNDRLNCSAIFYEKTPHRRHCVLLKPFRVVMLSQFQQQVAIPRTHGFLKNLCGDFRLFFI